MAAEGPSCRVRGEGFWPQMQNAISAVDRLARADSDEKANCSRIAAVGAFDEQAGTRLDRARTSSPPANRASSFSPPMVATETGTSWMFSERFWAVTITSLSAVGVSWAKAGAASADGERQGDEGGAAVEAAAQRGGGH